MEDTLETRLEYAELTADDLRVEVRLLKEEIRRMKADQAAFELARISQAHGMGYDTTLTPPDITSGINPC
jgi:hypothetical protein